MTTAPKPLLALCAAALGLTACAAVVDHDNIEPVAQGDAYQAQYREPAPREDAPILRARDMNASKCLPPRGGEVGDSFEGGKGTVGAVFALRGEFLSRGDLVEVLVSGDETFSDRYEVSRDGVIRLPYLSPVVAQGRRIEEVEADIASALMSGGYFDTRPLVSVRLQDYAAASVGVTGAVFEPRPVEIGGVNGGEVDRGRQDTLGATTEARDLANAIRAAGGIRPDADLSAVELRRNGQLYILDLREVLTGRDRADIMLLTGDEITVPSRMCFQDHLMVPSPISPPGITLFLSNLTQPAAGNALSAIGKDVREVPYGTRYMQAVIDTNCVGGTRTTNAHRSAALYTRNPMTGVSAVVERDIEGMMRRADRDDYDPFLLPGDAIACYDSAVTNATGLGSAIGSLPLSILP
ncbi:polysaccharide biosynthesis/export protein [Maritimibacter alkaliphilus HTCC2654]|uniref:Polysaccharide biosynthesis/export protein n=1 Tax=Maritimibacter alkaliphilus HTCC2654 TaxID=314271 RepID=A3VF50_9RHOB|nr:polysaccharide biosynthesis/export family protein [Maritimibacter alkaliphilus]EAQ12965.1 polysaccharide biosynthesis/export protein [Rhodobacterales bacterium HTCC2654] [Maritimibacter alkaliphilus HTCC2654]TYP79899.1 polysaccharide biosynthesis/export protein [Maritimibacter alkaliphilus HTCC2654]